LNKLLLASELSRVRNERGLSLRDVTDQCGVSESTISRIERNITISTPDTHNVEKLSDWMGIPFDRIMGTDKGIVTFRLDEPTPEKVAAIIFADPDLSDAMKTAIIEVVRVAYKHAIQMKGLNRC
jgi:transcriptional regulator with XRE-family HTH domain